MKLSIVNKELSNSLFTFIQSHANKIIHLSPGADYYLVEFGLNDLFIELCSVEPKTIMVGRSTYYLYCRTVLQDGVVFQNIDLEPNLRFKTSPFQVLIPSSSRFIASAIKELVDINIKEFNKEVIAKFVERDKFASIPSLVLI